MSKMTDDQKQAINDAEDRLCTCGAGHGSGYGHTDWCDWSDPNVRRRARRAALTSEDQR